MTEFPKEQHPLLCDELSEEERYSPPLHRRRPMSYRNRARYHVKGAAALFKRWPDHWTSFLTYWWIGIGMISLTTFILYNSLYAFSIIPLIHSKPTKFLFPNLLQTNESVKSPQTPEVFMHVFYLPNEEVDFDKYLPHIEDTLIKYPKFEYTLVIVINDTFSSESKNLNAEEVNEIALNTLLSNEVPRDKPNKIGNVNLKYITLSEYMDNSPVVKSWRYLSNDIVEFMLRSLSIWDRGGIAFDPSILSPQAFKEAYRQKFYEILLNYHNLNVVARNKIQKHLNIKNETKKKVNNIGDIIEALEHEENSSNDTEQSLDEAENKAFNVQANNIREKRSAKYNDFIDTVQDFAIRDKKIDLSHSVHENEKNKLILTSAEVDNGNRYKFNVSNTLSMLPSFLEYLFHGKHYNHKLEETPVSQLEVTTTADIDKIISNVITTDVHNEIKYSDKALKDGLTDAKNSVTTTNYIRGKLPVHSSHYAKEPIETFPMNNKNRLTIDLKGHIVATETPCHAFLGTLYSNAIHHPRPATLTNLLISELSTFCKGLSFTCAGVDLILV